MICWVENLALPPAGAGAEVATGAMMNAVDVYVQVRVEWLLEVVVVY